MREYRASRFVFPRSRGRPCGGIQGCRRRGCLVKRKRCEDGRGARGVGHKKSYQVGSKKLQGRGALMAVAVLAEFTFYVSRILDMY